MKSIDLSIVIPVFNEAPVLEELIARCRSAARETGLSCEIIIVDDCSTDQTPEIIGELGVQNDVVCHRNSENQGQFISTKNGLMLARGETVVVLDGDLQDPPEMIPDLIRAMPSLRRGAAVAAFAVKSSRHEPAWFMAAQALFHFLQSYAGKTEFPRGAGSFCAMNRALAARVARAPMRQGNIASVLAAMHPEFVCVPYRKMARYDSISRVGLIRLIQEALSSLLLSGALTALFWMASLLLGVLGLVLLWTCSWPMAEWLGYGCLAGGVLAGVAGIISHRILKGLLKELRAGSHPVQGT